MRVAVLIVILVICETALIANISYWRGYSAAWSEVRGVITARH